ncbi:MAG: 30S ribosome-binding factor RbfA [Ignavibacteriales bacterium]|nr:30S ribosome-binding factor RbfA [Ignavibacteriales bacterium]
MTHRIDKVSSLIKEELSLIFLHKVQDPNFGMITVTNVKMSPDLKHTKVYLSVYDKEKRALVLEKVNEIKGMIRSQLAGRIQVRFVPELHFFIDDTLDYVEKMEDLFKKIHESDNEKHDS